MSNIDKDKLVEALKEISSSINSIYCQIEEYLEYDPTRKLDNLIKELEDE